LTRAIELDPNGKNAHLYLLIWACATERKIEGELIDGLVDRFQYRPVAPSDIELAVRFQRVVIGAPECIQRNDVRRIFLAGSSNGLASASLRAQFLEVFSDYELVVSRDPVSAMHLLSEALRLTPDNLAMQKKLSGYRQQSAVLN
jgi:hypothetical protein